MASQHDERMTDTEKENYGNNLNSSSDDDNSCKHVRDGVNAKKIEKKAYIDLNCETCVKADDEKPSASITDLLPKDDLNDTSSPKDIHICLYCAKLHCGRNYKKHALQHYRDTDHPIALNVENLDVWCYKCDTDVVPATKRNQVVCQVQAFIRKQLRGKEMNEEESKEEISTYDYKRKWQYEVTAPGLTNLGNTCFFNSVMQVVVGTSVLHDVLTPSDPYYDTPHIDAAKCIAATDTENDAGPLTTAFKEFLHDMWRTREDTVTPRELFNQISRKWQQFRGWRQQDSQELMRFLFDGVKSEELSLIRKLQHQKSQDEDEEIADINEDEEDSENNENHTKKKETENYVSFIDACFGGRLVSVIVCDVCKNCSYSYEEFLDVSLPIKSSDDQYKSKNDYYSGYSGSYLYSGMSNTYDTFNKSSNEGNSSHTQSDDGSEHGDNAENPSEEVSSDTEIEEGIPVPSKEERKRIKLLLRDLPSDSGRSTPNSSKEPVTLRDCLKSFVKVETLEKDNSFACDNCWKLKEEHDEKLRVRENERISDTDDPLEDEQNTESGGNGIPSQENNNMEGIEYNTITNTDNTHLNESDESPPLESRMNETSSDADDDRHDDNRHDDNRHDDNRQDNNNFFNNNNDHLNSSYTDSLTTKRSKPVSQSEPKYILRKAYKRYLFDSLPPVLVFHLKRFQQVGGRWSVSMRKIDDFVSFDEELDVGDFVVPPEIEKKNEENGINNGHIIDGNTHSSSKQNKQNTKYRLYGVVVHLGSLYNGHYIAYVLSRNIRGEGEQYGLSGFPHETIKKAREFERVERQKHKTSGQRQWIYCSDSSVKSASVDEVLNNSGAYLLFYERVYE